MRGAVAKGAFELEHHRPIAIDTQTLLGNRRAGHLAAQALELGPLMGLAGDGTVEREASPCLAPVRERCRGTMRRR